MHLWLAEAKETSQSWVTNLRNLIALETIDHVYVGHQKIERVNSKDVFHKNIAYLEVATDIFGKNREPHAAADALKAAFPDYALPVIADIAAQAQLGSK